MLHRTQPGGERVRDGENTLFMKLNFFLPLLLFSCAACAQAPAVLQNLEGPWAAADRQQTIYSHWTFTAENTLLNRTFTLICGDTLLLSTAMVTFDAHTARLVLQADTLNGGVAQQFRLARADADALYWENENEGQTPARLSWILFGANYLSFRADGVETDYRFVKTGKARLQWRFQSGARWQNRRAFTNDIFPQDFNHRLVSYHIHPGVEYALSLGLRGGDSPLSCYIEIGYSEKRITVASILKDNQFQYLHKGDYYFNNLHLGLMPELVFGPRRAIGVTAGIFFNIRADGEYRGDVRLVGKGEPNSENMYPIAGKSPEGGLMLGAAYALPLPRMRYFHPEIYTRSILNIGGKPQFATLSAGVRLRMGKEG